MNSLLNISGLYDDECWSPSEPCRVVDLRGVEGCSCYCDAEALARLRSETAALELGALHWIDSGDYHYITLLFLERISEPFDLVLLDNHPDDQEPAFGADVLSCGSWVARARGALPLLRDVLWNPAPSAFDNAGGSTPVYLSIDLDVLSREFARTDWSQGEMTLEELCAIVASVARSRRVLGIDICGGLTVNKGACPEDLLVSRRTRETLEAFILRNNYL